MERQEFSEEELVPVSALEHYAYCPRQCALIHREQTFDENLYTLRGEAVHERVDEATVTTTGEGLRIERALPIWSARLGLIGKADVVEFRPSEHGETPYPVEYKSGPHSSRHADLQLCAQALCLEEMTGQEVPRGAVYQASSRKRREVAFTPQLRERVRAIILVVRRFLVEGAMPPPVADARCRNCSLLDSCLPTAIAAKGRARSLYSRLYHVEAEP